MTELAKKQDSDVAQVGNLMFVPEKNFQITQNGETEVLLGLWHDGTELAIKKMPLSQFSKVEMKLKKKHLMKSEIDSQNIVPYIDTAEDGNFGYVALQLCDDNLETIMKASQTTWDPKSKIQELLTGLKDLHEKKVIHGNIKPQNVLFGKYSVKASGSRASHHCFCSTRITWAFFLDNPRQQNSLSQIARPLAYYQGRWIKHLRLVLIMLILFLPCVAQTCL